MRHHATFLCLTLLLGLASRAGAQADPNRNPQTEECHADNNDATRHDLTLPAYPFDIDRIRFALKRLIPSGDKVPVLVVDNGFAGFFANGQRGPSTNFPQSFFFKDATGVPAEPKSDATAWEWGHGTHVTGIILGGMYGAHVPSTGELGMPEVRQLFFDDLTGAARAGGQQHEWMQLYVVPLQSPEHPSGDTLKLLTFKDNGIPPGFSPRIINMSLVHRSPGSEDVLGFRRLPYSFHDSLLVVSAGNASTRLDKDYGPFPAMSNPYEGNLIVVGAHDSNLDHASYSNFDPAQVTIAAPGCAIKSWLTGTGSAKAANGTSQAAALVSFAAALLESRWQTSPNDVRERLIASGRYSRSLAGGCTDQKRNRKMACVLFGNALDIEMALYYNIDAIEYCVKPGQRGPDCATRVALGDLLAAPDKVIGCVDDVEGKLAHDVTTLTLPSSIRMLEDGSHQILYRSQAPGNGETFAQCPTLASDSVGAFSFKLPDQGGDQPPQPPGAPPLRAGETLSLDASRVVRVVLRSKDDR